MRHLPICMLPSPHFMPASTFSSTLGYANTSIFQKFTRWFITSMPFAFSALRMVSTLNCLNGCTLILPNRLTMHQIAMTMSCKWQPDYNAKSPSTFKMPTFAGGYPITPSIKSGKTQMPVTLVQIQMTQDLDYWRTVLTYPLRSNNSQWSQWQVPMATSSLGHAPFQIQQSSAYLPTTMHPF